MRSRLTPRPARRADATAEATFAGSCVRSSAARTWGTADCMPIDSRVTPDAASSAATASVTVSGFASTVISAPSAMPNAVADAVQHAPEIAGRKEGRRPPAEEDGARRPHAAGLREDSGRETDLVQQRVGVLVLAAAAQLARGVRVEVAVAAAHAAEGHVQIHAERRGGIDRGIRRKRPIRRRGIAERKRGAHQAGVVYRGEIARR